MSRSQPVCYYLVYEVFPEDFLVFLVGQPGADFDGIRGGVFFRPDDTPEANGGVFGGVESSQGGAAGFVHRETESPDGRLVVGRQN